MKTLEMKHSTLKQTFGNFNGVLFENIKSTKDKLFLKLYSHYCMCFQIFCKFMLLKSHQKLFKIGIRIGFQ